MKKLAALALLLLLPREAHAHNNCVDSSDVVGDRKCTRYGETWSSERTFPVVVGTGLWSGHVVPSNRNWSGTFGKDAPIKFSLPGQQLGMKSVDDVGFDFRMHGYATKTFYLGVDWALALGRVKTNITPREGFEMRDKGSLNYIHAKLATVLGARLPLGPLSLRLEALIGVQIASVSLEGRSVTANGHGDWLKGSFSSVAFLLEPRVAVDVWTTPWSTISAWGGGSVLFPAERSMGLTIALHGRAFDGRF